MAPKMVQRKKKTQNTFLAKCIFAAEWISLLYGPTQRRVEVQKPVTRDDRVAGEARHPSSAAILLSLFCAIK